MSSNKDVRNDEIDLLELFRRIGRTISSWFKALGRGILISVVFLLKRWLPLGISLIIAIMISYSMKKSFTPYYTSVMTIRSNTLPNEEMISFINRLHLFCREQNVAALSEALSLSPEKAKKIKDIGAFWVIDKKNDGIPDYIDFKNKYNVYDTVNLRMQDRFVLQAKVSAPDDLPLLRNGIISFVSNNLLYRQKNDLRLAQIKELLTRLNYDIKQLDSLQKVKYFEETRSRLPQKSGQMVFLQEQKTQLIYDDIYTLYSRKQALDQQKDIYPDIITVISDFTVPVKPFTGLLYYGKVVVPLFLGLTLIVLICLANRKKIRDIIRKY